MTEPTHTPEHTDATPLRLAWLTPELRKAVYALMVSIGAVLGLLGVVDPEQWQPVTQSVDAVLASALVLTSMLALAHVPRRGA